MSKRFLIFSMIAVAAFMAMEAATVTESQARAIAGRFFNVTMPQQPATMKSRGAKAAYYVFEAPAKGLIIVKMGDSIKKLQIK